MSERTGPTNVFLPHLELLARERLEELQGRKLRRQVARLHQTNGFYRRLWDDAGVDVDAVRTRHDVARLPFTSKGELLADQEANPPYGR